MLPANISLCWRGEGVGDQQSFRGFVWPVLNNNKKRERLRVCVCVSLSLYQTIWNGTHRKLVHTHTHTHTCTHTQSVQNVQPLTHSAISKSDCLTILSMQAWLTDHLTQIRAKNLPFRFHTIYLPVCLHQLQMCAFSTALDGRLFSPCIIMASQWQGVWSVRSHYVTACSVFTECNASTQSDSQFMQIMVHRICFLSLSLSLSLFILLLLLRTGQRK